MPWPATFGTIRQASRRVVLARRRARIRMKAGAVAPDHSLTLVARNGAFPRQARSVFKGVDAAGTSARATAPLDHRHG
jgi:hypothetical protein